MQKAVVGLAVQRRVCDAAQGLSVLARERTKRTAVSPLTLLLYFYSLHYLRSNLVSICICYLHLHFII